MISVINVKKMDFSNVPLELLKKVMIIYTERLLEEISLPGQVENWNIIIDLKGMGFWSIDKTVVLSNEENVKDYFLSAGMLQVSSLQNLRGECSNVNKYSLGNRKVGFGPKHYRQSEHHGESPPSKNGRAY